MAEALKTKLKRFWYTELYLDESSGIFVSSLKPVLFFAVFYFAVFEYDASKEEILRGIVEFFLIAANLFLGFLLFTFLLKSYKEKVNKNFVPVFGYLLISFLIIYSITVGLIYPVKQFIWDIRKSWFLSYYLRHLPFAVLIYLIYLYRQYKNQEIDALIAKLNMDLESTVRKSSDDEESKFRFKLDGFIKSIPVKDISHITVDGHYLDLYYQLEGQPAQVCIRQTLKSVLEDLPDEKFIRIHRSHLVNVDYVMKIEKIKRNYFIKLKNRDFLPVSRNNLTSVVDYFERDLK